MTAAAFLQSHRAPQHSWQTPQTMQPFLGSIHFEILYVFWELLLRLSRDSWEPFEEDQGACCCQERSAARGCHHRETLAAGGAQKPAQHQGDEGENGWILSETCSLMRFNPSCTEDGSSSISAYWVGKWKLPNGSW